MGSAEAEVDSAYSTMNGGLASEARICSLHYGKASNSHIGGRGRYDRRSWSMSLHHSLNVHKYAQVPNSSRKLTSTRPVRTIKKTKPSGASTQLGSLSLW
jgi:hypothetical protein